MKCIKEKRCIYYKMSGYCPMFSGNECYFKESEKEPK